MAQYDVPPDCENSSAYVETQLSVCEDIEPLLGVEAQLVDRDLLARVAGVARFVLARVSLQEADQRRELLVVEAKRTMRERLVVDAGDEREVLHIWRDIELGAIVQVVEHLEVWDGAEDGLVALVLLYGLEQLRRGSVKGSVHD